LETRLELQSEICEDLIENLVEEEQNLFFDVLIDDESRRNLMPKRLQHLLKEWGLREINLFK
jgi:DNA replication initiation complex subunit (GINS family)